MAREDTKDRIQEGRFPTILAPATVFLLAVAFLSVTRLASLIAVEDEEVIEIHVAVNVPHYNISVLS